MNRFKLAPLTVLALLFGANAAWTADNTLYDAPPPDDAVFIRWLDGGTAPAVLGVSSLGETDDAFRPASAALTSGALEGAFYSAAIDATGHVVIIQEPARDNKAQVLLTLLNLSNQPVRLSLAEHDVDVIGSTAINTAEGRSVNPVAARLLVLSAENSVLGTFDVQLRRGQNLTFVARPEGAHLIENRFGTNIEG